MEERKRLMRLFSSMKQARVPFEDYWREVSQHVDPRRGRFYDEDRNNKGRRKDKDLINNRILQAKRICVSGLYAGTVSPAKPWFKFETGNKSRMSISAVKRWTYEVEEIMRGILSVSNFYPAITTFLDEFVTYSTAAMVHEDDVDTIAAFHTFTIGRYYAAFDTKGNLIAFAVRTKMTAPAMAERYGKDKLSSNAKTQAERDNHDTEFTVIQIIEKNKDFREDALESQFKRYRSTTLEESISDNTFLEVTGFDEMPSYVARWETVENDPYGYGAPGMVALGDNKALQIEEKEKAKAIEKMAAPLLKGPSALKNLNVPNRGNGLIVYDDFGSGTGLSPVYQVDPRIQELRADMQAIERRIDQAFFVDLFQAISSLQGVQPRNELEITQRNQESLLLLGPALERFQRDFLVRVLERVFKQAFDRGVLPPPPEELEGDVLDIRFISFLAQAQRSVEVGNIERYISFIGNFAALKPEVLDKVDADATADLYAHMTGVVPNIVPDNEAVGEVRQARAQAQEAQAQAQMQNQQASANVQNASAAKQIAEIVGG